MRHFAVFLPDAIGLQALEAAPETAVKQQQPGTVAVEHAVL